MLANIKLQSEGQQRLRTFLIVFRWLALLLGLIMTGFGNSREMLHPLPSIFADMPILLVLLQFVYHLIASIVCLKFDESKFNVALLMLMDLCAGGFMAWFYGMPYLYLTVLLPVIEAAFYFGTFIAAIIFIMGLAFFGPLILGQVVKNLSSNPLQKVLLQSLWDQAKIFGFSSLAIFLNFAWAVKQEEDIANLVRKFQEEKNILFESHQSTKKEFTAVFAELEKKQESLENFEKQLNEKEEEINVLLEEHDKKDQELEELRESMKETAQVSLEQHKKMLLEQKELLKAKEAEIEEIKAQMEEEMEEYRKQMEEEWEEASAKYEDELDSLKNRTKHLEMNMGSAVTQHLVASQDLEEKISVLVVKNSELNLAIKDRENIVESFAKLLAGKDRDAILLAILQEALKINPSQTAIIFLKDESSADDVYFAEVAATPYQNLFIDYSVPKGEGPVGYAVARKEALRIDKGGVKLKDGTHISTLIRYEKSALAVPIMNLDQVLGVLYMGKPEENAYEEVDIPMMKMFGKLAGAIITKTGEMEKASGVTLVDEATGLYNETYFFERFPGEAARSKRYNIPVTLVLMEITNFEKFNESADQKVSDKLVKDLAEILNSNVRETDIVARIGEGTFAVLFFHSFKSDTVLIADRIRTGVELRSLGTAMAKKAGLHLAVGLAGMPEDSDNKDELYSQAYRYLEEAKRKGGSQVYFPP